MFVCLFVCLFVRLLAYFLFVFFFCSLYFFYCSFVFLSFFLIRLFTVPSFSRKIVKIERFALRVAVLNECQNYIGGGGCPLSSFNTHPS